MFKFLTPLILVLIAGATFFLYTNPKYQEIKTLRLQEREYDDALTKSKELQQARNQLIAKSDTFSPDDIRKLERLLPDNVDNIRLILDIDNIAMRYGLRIRGVSVSDPKGSRKEVGGETIGAAQDKIGSVELSFTIAARYEDFLRFLGDLERSVRVVDIQTMAFTVGEGDLVQYSLLIKTYWLR